MDGLERAFRQAMSAPASSVSGTSRAPCTPTHSLATPSRTYFRYPLRNEKGRSNVENPSDKIYLGISHQTTFPELYDHRKCVQPQANASQEHME